METYIDYYIQKALEANACEEYMAKLQSCLSRKQMVDVALSIGALPFVAKSIATGIFPLNDVEKDFAIFSNGNYVRDADGYTSAMYINQHHIDINTTCALVVNCDEVTVHTPICELHIVGNQPCINGPGNAKLSIYNQQGIVNHGV